MFVRQGRVACFAKNQVERGIHRVNFYLHLPQTRSATWQSQGCRSLMHGDDVWDALLSRQAKIHPWRPSIHLRRSRTRSDVLPFLSTSQIIRLRCDGKYCTIPTPKFSHEWIGFHKPCSKCVVKILRIMSYGIISPLTASHSRRCWFLRTKSMPSDYAMVSLILLGPTPDMVPDKRSGAKFRGSLEERYTHRTSFHLKGLTHTWSDMETKSVL